MRAQRAYESFGPLRKFRLVHRRGRFNVALKGGDLARESSRSFTCRGEKLSGRSEPGPATAADQIRFSDSARTIAWVLFEAPSFWTILLT
jgi:hypothetical protein